MLTQNTEVGGVPFRLNEAYISIYIGNMALNGTFVYPRLRRGKLRRKKEPFDCAQGDKGIRYSIQYCSLNPYLLLILAVSEIFFGLTFFSYYPSAIYRL